MLHNEKWSPSFGLAAIVLCPTRELALQIFEVLRKIGHHHPFSAGLVIGGKDKNEEALRINQMNILIATPGRLLQHMSETPNFECSNLLMVVLDEADRILDPGFKNDIDAIFAEFPQVCPIFLSASCPSCIYKHIFTTLFISILQHSFSPFAFQDRQTLLFSATQTQSVRTLSRAHMRV